VLGILGSAVVLVPEQARDGEVGCDPPSVAQGSLGTNPATRSHPCGDKIGRGAQVEVGQGCQNIGRLYVALQSEQGDPTLDRAVGEGGPVQDDNPRL
jgi:hypothetical protein